jgi:hypothetical protein
VNVNPEKIEDLLSMTTGSMALVAGLAKNRANFRAS